MAQGDLELVSFRGGMIDSDPSIGLADDEVASAVNVEFFSSMLGERRLGCTPINLTNPATAFSNQTANTGCFHVDQWFPTNDPTAPEWFVGVGTTPTNLGFLRSNNFGTSWNTVGLDDQSVGTIPAVYQVNTQPLDGVIPLFFFAYQAATANLDRMHVYDSDVQIIRRAGFASTGIAAPSVVDNGSGTFSEPRYYRIRVVQLSVAASQLVRRSEPGSVTTFTPSGSGSGAKITQPSLLGERETHWEIEASEDNATFYRIAQLPVATTTFTDTTAYATGYASNPQSDPLGTYFPLPAARYLSADSDRLLLGGHVYDQTRMSSIYWTPVFNDPFPGQFERFPQNVNNSINLDNGDGGPISGISHAINGQWYVFKWSKIYTIVRVYNATIPYTVFVYSTESGALPGSVFEGLDEKGEACVYFLDPVQGPARIGIRGLQFMDGLRNTWKRINLHAKLPAFGIYYPYKRQAKWWVAADGNTTPSLILHNQITNLRPAESGHVRGGWSLHTGQITKGFCAALLTGVPVSNNVLDSLNPRPVVGMLAPFLLQSCDVTDYDSSLPYTASITTKQYVLEGALNEFGPRAATGFISPSAVQSLIVTIIRDFGVETLNFTLSMTPQGSETVVVSDIDNLAMSDVRSLQLAFTDAVTNP